MLQYMFVKVVLMKYLLIILQKIYYFDGVWFEILNMKLRGVSYFDVVSRKGIM